MPCSICGDTTTPAPSSKSCNCVPGRVYHITADALAATCVPTGLLLWVTDGDEPGLYVGTGDGAVRILTADDLAGGLTEARVAEMIAVAIAALNIPTIVNATTTVRGIIEIATITETRDGTSSTLAVTPAGLKAVIDDLTLGNVPNATTTVAGIVELATNAETIAGTSAELVVTPAGLTAFFNALSIPVTATFTAGYVPGSSLAINHGLGVTPRWARIGLVATADIPRKSVVTGDKTAGLVYTNDGGIGMNPTQITAWIQTNPEFFRSRTNQIVDATQEGSWNIFVEVWA